MLSGKVKTMRNDEYFEMAPSLVAPFDKSARRTLNVDVTLYKQHLAESGMLESEKKEFLEAVWTVIWNFVELGLWPS